MGADRGIQRFDPQGRWGVRNRVVSSALKSAPTRRLVALAVRCTDGLVRRLTASPWAPLLVLPFADLTTTGARSGRARTAAVLYFSDGEDVILIASNWGRHRHPAWYHNLSTHPAAVLTRGGRSATYSAVEVTGPFERDRLFALADRVYPGYAEYRARATKTGRRIPIMRLRLVS